jgi:hypothetical protein
MRVDEDGSGSGLRNDEVEVGASVDVPDSSVDGLLEDFMSKSWNWDVVVDKWELDRDLDFCESSPVPSI